MNHSHDTESPSTYDNPEIKQLLLCFASTDAFEKNLTTLDPEMIDHITSCPVCFPLFIHSHRIGLPKQEPEITTLRLDKKISHGLRWIILEEMLDRRLKQIQDILPFAFSMPVPAVLRGISPPFPDTEITKAPFDLDSIYATISEHPPRIFQLNLCRLASSFHELKQLHFSRDPYQPENLVIRLYGLDPDLAEYDAYLVSTPVIQLQALTDSTDPECLIGILREKLETLAQCPDPEIVDLFAGIFDHSMVIRPKIGTTTETESTIMELPIDTLTSALLVNKSRMNFLVWGSERLLG